MESGDLKGSSGEEGDKEIDITAWLPKGSEGGITAGCLRYVLPVERAKQKVVHLLERVVKGEVEYFAVGLYEVAPPRKKR